MSPEAGSPSPSALAPATSPEGRGLGSDCKVCGFVRSSPFGGAGAKRLRGFGTLTFFVRCVLPEGVVQ